MFLEGIDILLPRPEHGPYDANEEVALKLCTEGLDYFTRGKNGKKSYYQCFWKGLAFFYYGKNKDHIMYMMGQHAG